MLEQLSFNVQKNQRNQRIHKKIIFILLQCLLAILIIENVCVVIAVKIRRINTSTNIL